MIRFEQVRGAIIRRRTLALACLALVAFSLPYWLLSSGFWLTVGTLTCVYAIAGIGWVVIGGFAGQASFGNSVFLGIGAYGAALAQTGPHYGPWTGLLMGVGATILAAILIGIVSFRSRGIYFALVTFTTTLIFEIFAQYFSFTGGAVGLNLASSATGWSNFVFASKNTYYFIALIVMIASAVIATMIGRSSFGVELKAIRDSAEAAAACGVRVRRMKMAAFVISAVLTCVAGWLYFELVGFIDPSSAFGLTIATLIPVIAMFGGARQVSGAIVGAIVLVPLQQYTGTTGLGGLPPGVGLIIFALLVLAVLWVEPRGVVMLVSRGMTPLRGAVAAWRGQRATADTATGPDDGAEQARPGTAVTVRTEPGTTSGPAVQQAQQTGSTQEGS